MIALLKTAERTNNTSCINNYVYQRHVFAYKAVRLSYISGKQVLELGCGEGFGVDILSPYTSHYLAVDKKKPAFEFPGNNTSFRQCILPMLSGIPSHSFDTVICFQVIEHIRKDHLLLQEIKRVLKPGGALLMTTPNKSMSLSRNPFHVREYLPDEMETLIRSHFSTYTIQGVCGNKAMMAYYEENKKSVAAIARYDILNLQYRMPAFLLRAPYTLLNNINRLFLLKKIAAVTANLTHHDFFLSEEKADCLDYFVMAIKE